VVTYNLPGVSTTLKMTPEIISGVFLGTIKKWNDPAIKEANPDAKLPDQAISVAHRSDGSGTTYIFTHYLTAVSSEWKSKVGAGKSVNWPVGLGGKGNEGVAGIVKQTPGSVGYVELAYAVQNKMPYADVRNLNGEFITPTIESTTAAANGGVEAMKKDIRSPIVNSPEKGAYPIAGFTYILLYKSQDDAAKAKAVVDFLHWAMQDGQKEAGTLLYAPLPASIVDLNEAALKTVQVNGQPVQ
jgi:phosphate transport system substrate-binding protein